MGDPRPVDVEDQAEQVAYLVDTGNGPTTDTESVLLADKYGDADNDGVYGAPATDAEAAA